MRSFLLITVFVFTTGFSTVLRSASLDEARLLNGSAVAGDGVAATGRTHLPEDVQRPSYDIIPHTHADLTWPDWQKVCLNALVESIVNTLEILKTHPDFRFSMETVYPLEQFLKRYPEKCDEIRSLIEKDVFDCGALYTGPWEVVCGQEGLIRHLYYGKKWLQDNFDIEVKTAWNPDVPGHTMQMPQILNKSNVEGFITWRDFTGPPVHWWLAPDGSRVLRVDCYAGYGASRPLGLRESLQRVETASENFYEGYCQLAKRTSVPIDLPVFVADGVDIEQPSARVPEIVKAWNRLGHDPPMQMKTGSDYIRHAARYDLPSVTGEQPCMWDGVFSEGDGCFQAMREARAELVAGEIFSTIASWLDPSFVYPQKQLDRAWRNFLIVTEHNWGGRHGEIANAIKTQQALAARDLATGVREGATRKIARMIRHKRRGIPVVVFNAFSWQRRDIAEARISFPSGEYRAIHLMNDEGTEVPAQVTRAERRSDESLIWAEIAFEADVPPVGYRTYYLREGAGKDSSPFMIQDHLYENAFYRVRIDPETGLIASLFSKKAGVEMARTDKYGFGELVLLEQKGTDIEYIPTGVVRKGLEFKADSIRVIENGPVRLVVRVEGPLLNSRSTVEYTLYRSLDKVGVRTIIDWNGDRDWDLRQCFPVRLTDDAQLTYEVPFASVRLGEENPYTRTKPVYRGVHNWVDHSDASGGLTLCTRTDSMALMDSLPEPSEMPLIQPLLLRTVRSCHGDGPYYEQKGQQSYEFAFHFHNGPLRHEVATRQGWELNSPLRTVVGEITRGGSLPAGKSFLSIDSPSVILSTLKRAEGSQEGWILRCWECKGEEAIAEFNLALPLRSVKKVNMLEQGLGEEIASARQGRFSVRLAPASIETYRLEFHLFD